MTSIDNAAIDRNLQILSKGMRIGRLNFAELYERCMEKTGTTVPGWKIFRRRQRAFHLAQYFDYALGIPGSRVECGVFRGFSALMLSRVAAMRHRDFNGEDFHLVDSFEGLSPPTEADATEQRILPNGTRQFAASFHPGHFTASIEGVRGALSEFPDLRFHKGWIPEILKELPESAWSFVHIDVDLYEPTLACLEYFAPRLAAGGVIVNDDFNSPLFPGGGRAWREYCEAKDLFYVALDTGQAVFIRAS